MEAANKGEIEKDCKKGVKLRRQWKQEIIYFAESAAVLMSPVV